MFYTEDDVQPIVDLAVKIFGRSNQYHTWSEGQIMMNVVLMTRKFGKIWSGDLLLGPGSGASEEVQKKLNLLSDSVGQKIFLIDDDDDFDFTRAIGLSQGRY